MTRVRVTPRRGNLPSKVLLKTTKHDKISVGNHGYHYNKAGKAYTLYYCEYRSKQGCDASLQLYNDGTRIRHEEHTCHPPPASIEAQTIRTRRFARIDLNAFNKTPNYPIPGTSEYYEKTLDDPNINLLTFDPDGPTYKFNYSDFEEIETIASSRHVVKKFLHNPSGRHLAIKFVHIPHNRHATDEENVKKLKYLVREIDNFRALKKEGNLVKFYGFCLHESQALICMELMDLSLKELILRFQEMTISFPEDLLGRVIVGIIKALDACKTHKIMHREVKPENILINKEGQIKLRDFGESRILHDSLASTFVGKCSIAYWPPERFENEKSKFDLKADIWSFGITLIEAVAGQVPYKDRKGNVPNNIILLQNLILNLDTSQTVEDTFVGYSENLKNFVKTCLNRVETRPEYGDLMMTEVYKKYDVANSDIRLFHK